MNISQEKTGNVSVKLTVAIEENDYKDKVVKELKEIGKKHAIPDSVRDMCLSANLTAVSASR